MMINGSGGSSGDESDVETEPGLTLKRKVSHGNDYDDDYYDDNDNNYCDYDDVDYKRNKVSYLIYMTMIIISHPKVSDCDYDDDYDYADYDDADYDDVDYEVDAQPTKMLLMKTMTMMTI